MSLELLLLVGIVAAVAYLSVQQVTKSIQQHSIQARNGIRRHELWRVLNSANRLQRQLDLLLDRNASEVLAVRGIRELSADGEERSNYNAEIIRVADLEFSVRDLSGALAFCTVFVGQNWFKLAQQVTEDVEKMCRDYRRYKNDTAEGENANLKAAAIDYAISAKTFPFSDFDEDAKSLRATLSRLEDGLKSKLALY